MKKLLAALALTATAASAGHEQNFVGDAINAGVTSGVSMTGSAAEVLAQQLYIGILMNISNLDGVVEDDIGDNGTGYTWVANSQVCMEMSVDGWNYVPAGTNHVPQGILDWAENDGHVGSDLEGATLIAYALNSSVCNLGYKTNPVTGEVVLVQY